MDCPLSTRTPLYRLFHAYGPPSIYLHNPPQLHQSPPFPFRPLLLLWLLLRLLKPCPLITTVFRTPSLSLAPQLQSLRPSTPSCLRCQHPGTLPLQLSLLRKHVKLGTLTLLCAQFYPRFPLFVVFSPLATSGGQPSPPPNPPLSLPGKGGAFQRAPSLPIPSPFTAFGLYNSYDSPRP